MRISKPTETGSYIRRGNEEKLYQNDLFTTQNNDQINKIKPPVRIYPPRKWDCHERGGKICANWRSSSAVSRAHSCKSLNHLLRVSSEEEALHHHHISFSEEDEKEGAASKKEKIKRNLPLLDTRLITA